MLVFAGSVRNNFGVRLSRRTDYSFRLLILLGIDSDRTVPLSDAAARLGVSSNHLAKIAQELAHAGIVETVRGRNGGVRLTEHGLSMRVGDVVRALEPVDLVECFDAEANTCRLSPSCRLASILEDAGEAFLASLDAYRVSDLCSKPAKLRRLLVLPG